MVVIAAAGCSKDDGPDAADQIGSDLFEAIAQGNDQGNPGVYQHNPMPDGACGAVGEAWYGRRTWQLAGELVPRDEVMDAAIAHLDAEGFEVRTFHSATSTARALESTRGTDAVRMIVSSNGATSIVVYVGPCGASSSELQPDWVPGDPPS